MQAAFADALLARDVDCPPGLRTWNGSDPGRRFAVYRNNVIVGLVDALADTYPVVQAMVGDDFFRAMAREFVRSQPPTSPVLAGYGAGFAAFIEGFAPAAGLPCLADLARLEWLRVEVYHAADVAPLRVEEIAPRLAPGAILSDVGSVKAAIVRDVGPHVPAGVHFVPAHPVAGTENSGPDAGFAELFINRWCILTPPEGTDPGATDKLATFWSALGANVETMTPEHHDLVLAITSHVPHLIAYTIVGTADELEQVTRSEVLKFSAGGFRDFTRIAASDPTMWRDVFLANKDAVLEMLGTFSEDLATLTRAIRRGDGDTLFELFTRTRAIRRGIVSIGQDSDTPDFGRPHDKLPPLPRPYMADGE